MAGAIALVLIAAQVAIIFKRSWIDKAAVIVIILTVLAMLICLLYLCRRRWNDLGRSGWWSALLLVPAAGLLALVVLVIAEAESDSNDFGPAPPEGGSWLIGYSMFLGLMIVLFVYLVRA
ncbi:Uncharacterized membrane protein YhaH, DUF805 family [Massilia sp. CF038]|nr:Uncharacterized membrane protein YhaH, DUF805 family [Massilia sp. CF038]